MTADAIASAYFALSNARDLESIFAMFAADATYSSDNTGLYFGVQDIREMMTAFFEAFPSLHWDVHSRTALSDHIVEIQFTLKARNNANEELVHSGTERIVVSSGKITHVEVRNR